MTGRAGAAKEEKGEKGEKGEREGEIQRKLDGYDTTLLTDAERGYWDQFERQRHSGG